MGVCGGQQCGETLWFFEQSVVDGNIVLQFVELDRETERFKRKPNIEWDFDTVDFSVIV